MDGMSERTGSSPPVSTKPAGSVKIRVETITHYLEKYAGEIIRKKKAAMGPDCPLLARPAEAQPA
jgi:hypothetical protein